MSLFASIKYKLFLAGIVVLLIVLPVWATYVYTQPPQAFQDENGVRFGNTMYNDTDVITDNVTAKNVTATTYTTTSGRRLDNGGCGASYCIRMNGSIVEAVNGTGYVEFSGADASTVLNNTFNINGTSVNLACGNYSVNEILMKRNQTLSGSGYCSRLSLSVPGGTILRFLDGQVSPAEIISNEVRQIRFYGVEGATSTGIDVGAYNQQFKILNNWFENYTVAGAAAIRTTTNKKFQISNNFFGASGYAVAQDIRLSATGDVEITGNNFHNFDYGITGNTEKTAITGNTFYFGEGSNKIAINLGTSAGGLQEAQIVGNTFSDITTGIKLGQNTGNGTIIIGNFFRDIDNNAIYLRGKHNVVQGNFLQNVSVSGAGNNGHGILIDAGSEYNIISGNTGWNDNTNMAYAIAELTGVIGNNQIFGNSIQGAQSGAVRDAGTSNSSIYNNFGSSPFNFGNNATAPIAFGAGDNYRNTSKAVPNLCTSTASGTANWVFEVNGTSGC